VYRARDTRLGRDVAIKILSSRITTDSGFRERFDREAQTISHLSHPHICTLHDVGEQDGVAYLVLEYVEGETLAARLAKGPLSIQQALAIGIQISDALDQASRQGIVHRDLKPGNVMLVGRSASTPHAKLLDFGLAKAIGPGLATSVATLTLTATSPLTAQGTLLGTLQYMSPEQIEGRAADARSDIFAVGAILHEMVSGQRAFDGKSPASVIAAILERDPPPLSTLQTLAPPALDHIVARCLAKDPDDRWQSAGDVMRELKWVASSPATLESTPRSTSRFREYLWMALALALALALGVLGLTRRTPSAQPVRPIQTSLLPPAGVTWSAAEAFSVSPDGRHLVFVARAAGEEPRLRLYSFDTGEAKSLVGTERGNLPFWSADGRNIGFFVLGQLKRVGLDGTVQSVCALGEGVGGTWNHSDVILFADAGTTNQQDREPSKPGLFRVPARGGKPVQLTDRGHWPIFLPDGERFLYVDRGDDGQPGARRRLYAASLGAPQGHPVIDVGSNVAFAEPGYLFYVRGRTLVVQPFDAEPMKTRGEAQPVGTDVAFSPYGDRGAFSVSNTGVLVYRVSPPEANELVWLDRSGNRLGVLGPPGRYADPALSPDEKTVAFAREDRPTGTSDIWLVNVARPVPFKFSSGGGRAPVWSPNGDRIVFWANRGTDSGLYVQRLDGGKAQLLVSARNVFPADWSDQGVIVGTRLGRTGGIFKVPASGGEVSQVLDEVPIHEENPTFSPHGRWVSYQSDATGTNQVYVLRFDGSGRPEPISSGQGGGVYPRWRPDGKDLYYLTTEPDRWLMAVNINAGETLAVGTARRLFPVRTGDSAPVRSPYSVTRDGQRFLFVLPLRDDDALPLTVVVNWPSRSRR
jgi:Tol biopolymer transport system component